MSKYLKQALTLILVFFVVLSNSSPAALSYAQNAANSSKTESVEELKSEAKEGKKKTGEEEKETNAEKATEKKEETAKDETNSDTKDGTKSEKNTDTKEEANSDKNTGAKEETNSDKTTDTKDNTNTENRTDNKTDSKTDTKTDAKEDTDKKTETPDKTNDKEDKKGGDYIELSADVDNVDISLKAEKGAFPDGVSLSVTKASVLEQDKVDRAVSAQRSDERNVALSYTFDIRVFDKDGKELQPAEGKNVAVSFSTDTVSNANLDTDIYHVKKAAGATLSAEALEVTTEGETATVETDGFSYYTVEFTYGDKQYVMKVGDTVKLNDIMMTVGLTGDVAKGETSNERLFQVYEDLDEWYVVSWEPFDTKEWMKLTVDGVDYDIDFLVTDSSAIDPQTNGIWAKEEDIATYTIDIRNKQYRIYSPSGNSSNNGDLVSKKGDNNTIPGTSNLASVMGVRQGYTYKYNQENSISGTSYVRYFDAATNSKGEKFDVIFEYSNIKVYPRTDQSGTTFTEDYVKLFQAYDTNSNTKEKGYPAVYFGLENNSGSFNAWAHVMGCTLDLRFFIAEKGVPTNGVFTNNYVQNKKEGTFIYSAYDINIYKDPATNSISGKTYDHASHYDFAETIEVTGDYSSQHANGKDSGAFHPAYEDGVFSPGIGPYSHQASEMAGVSSSAGSGVKMHITSGFAGQATRAFFLVDGVTHNLTSSSGNYGKIELWEDGKTDKTGTAKARNLYGGRYEPASTNRSGATIAEVNQKRIYDVPDGKTVQYKLTPEDGYILDTLTFTGDKGTLTAHYEDDHEDSGEAAENTTYTRSPIAYYIYEVPASEIDDEEIRVTWKPAVAFTGVKNWNDDNDKWGLRPDSVKYELQNASGREDTVITLKKSTTEYASGSPTNNTPDWSHTWYNLPKYGSYNSATNEGSDIVKYTIKETALDDTAAKYYTEVKPHKLTKKDTTKTAVHIVDNDPDVNDHHDFTTESLTYEKRDITYTITNRLEQTDVWVEKDAYPNYESGDSFTFEIEITNADISSAPSGWTEKNPGTSGVYTRTLTIPTSDGKYKDVFTDIPVGTQYKIAEKSVTPDGKWKLVSVTNGTSGTVGQNTTAWSRTSKKEVFFGSAGNYTYYEDDDPCHHDALAYNLPTPPTVSGYPKYYDCLGFETNSSGSNHTDDNKSIDSSEYPSGANTPYHRVNYASSYTEESCSHVTPHATHKYIALKGEDISSESWTFTVPENDDTMYAKAAHYHYFKNVKLADLTVGKEVTGNQASRDKYFKFEIKISNAKDVKYITLDTAECDSDFNSGHAIEGNSATVYDAGTMNSANGKDEKPSDIEYETLDYDVIMGNKTTSDIKIAGNVAQEVEITGGEATFYIYLQHGQKLKIKGLPVDAQYTITEEEEDYKPYVEAVSGIGKDNKTGDAITVGDCPRVRSSGTELNKVNRNTITDTNLAKDAEVKFTNKRGGTIPTEVRVPIVIGGLALVLAALVWFIYKHRKNRREVYED